MTSVLVDFDAGDVLDAVSLGIIVLDVQLCAVYANLGAEELLAVPAERLRGRPLASFLPQPQSFLHAVQQAIERGQSVVFDLTGLSLRVAPMRDQLSGRHLLLELCGARTRREIAPIP
jgi:nitrogen-specific signal transduction histidine kinase